MTASFDEIESALTDDGSGVALVPALVKGRLLLPRRPSVAELRSVPVSQHRARFDDVLVLRRPTVDRRTLAPTGTDQFLVTPAVDPHELVEHCPDAIARDLMALPVADVLAFASGLAAAIDPARPLAQAVARTTKATAAADDRMVELSFAVMAEMLDADAIAEAIDRELGRDGIAGRRFLDEWVPVPTEVRHGVTARMSDGVAGERVGAVRAAPTRQLHVTAGNSLIVPLVSIVRALSTKGAAVVKSPAQAMAAATLLAVAVQQVDPDHPIARHLSLVYWFGGDRDVEDVLFRPASFDRLVVWGAPETVQDVAGRAAGLKTVWLNPRYGLSLVGREVFDGHLVPVVERLAADILIGDQQACNASLVIYLEASEDEALVFCVALQESLARWDQRIGHHVDDDARTKLRRLQRGGLAAGTWFENGRWPDVTSAVVYAPRPLDISQHPMSRCAIVRTMSDLSEALEFVHPAVATVGVFPEHRRLELRDRLVARGVSNVAPLGDAERSYPGQPHDGMAVLSELVAWVSA